MKFKNKILCLFLILIIGFFLIVPSSKAAFSYGGYDFPDMPSDFDNYEYKVIVYSNTKNAYYLFLSDMPFLRDNTCAFDNTIPCFLVCYTSYKLYEWIPSSTGEDFSSFSLSASDNKSGTSYRHFMDNTWGFSVLYSSHEILHGTDEQEGEVFFWRTPLMHSTVTQSLIGANICQIVMPTIPVGLIVLSMVLIIFLVRLVILRLM